MFVVEQADGFRKCSIWYREYQINFLVLALHLCDTKHLQTQAKAIRTRVCTAPLRLQAMRLV